MEQQKQPKRIKVSLKRKKPAGKPPVAPEESPKTKPLGRKSAPRKKPNIFQQMQQDAIEQLNKLDSVFKQKPTCQLQEVSPVLTDMLQKLSGWTPQSNEGVLEVANRLAQAAKEEIDKGIEKKAKVDTVEYAKGLLFHTLTYWNGVSSEHSLITGVEYSKGNSTVSFRMVRVFNYNRIGTPAMLYSSPTYSVTDIHPPMTKQRQDEVCIQGKYYHIDMPKAMDAIMTEVIRYQEQFKWLIDNAKVGRLKKLWDRSKKSTR